MKNLFVLLMAGVVLSAVAPTNAQDGQKSRNQLPQAFRNIELSEAQRQTADAISKKFRDQLTALVRKQNQIYTPQQVQARRDAIAQAREQKKPRNQWKLAVDEATKLTAEQKASLNKLDAERRELQTAMQNEIKNILTRKQLKQIGKTQIGKTQNRRSRIPPTHADVSYGPHTRNVMDVWLAKSDRPTPVFFSIHGGGFRGGNKGVDGGLLKACLDQGISVVAITYRLSGEAIAPAQFNDSARAVQFVRSQSAQWNMDKTRFASSGGSAGAGLSMWLAFHDDLADAGNADPVLRESTRLKCAVVFNGQSTYDPREIFKFIPEAETYKEGALEQLYDIDLSNGLEGVSAEKWKLAEQCSPAFHLTQDDVPVLLAYASKANTEITSRGIGIHHPRFGKYLKDKMDPLGIECQVETGVRRGSQEWIEQTMEFLNKHL